MTNPTPRLLCAQVALILPVILQLMKTPVLLLGLFSALIARAAGETAHCATVGTHNPVGEYHVLYSSNNGVRATETVDSFVGIYHSAPFCPSSCFSACTYGCLSCKVRVQSTGLRVCTSLAS